MAYRKKISKKRSKKMFRKGARRINKKNRGRSPVSARGGIRL